MKDKVDDNGHGCGQRIARRDEQAGGLESGKVEIKQKRLEVVDIPLLENKENDERKRKGMNRTRREKYRCGEIMDALLSTHPANGPNHQFDEQTDRLPFQTRETYSNNLQSSTGPLDNRMLPFPPRLGKASFHNLERATGRKMCLG